MDRVGKGCRHADRKLIWPFTLSQDLRANELLLAVNLAERSHSACGLADVVLMLWGLRLDDRYWHLADNPAAPAFVRFWGTADNGGFWPAMVCPLVTQSGHSSDVKGPIFLWNENGRDELHAQFGSLACDSDPLSPVIT